MKNIIVDSEFWKLFPDAQINLLVIKNIDNSVSKGKEKYFVELLNQGKKAGMQFLDHEIFSENKVIREWREAFKKFKTKKGARSSIEALLKRVNQNRDFSPINPLVDIYNSISMKYAVPAGGEDLDKIVGNLHLGKAEGGESFFPLGAEKDSPALPEELIYYDEKGAICRCLNWREAQRTMLQETTQNAILVIEAINCEQAVRAGKAILELKEQVDDLLDTESKNYLLNKENPTLVNFL